MNPRRPTWRDGPSGKLNLRRVMVIEVHSACFATDPVVENCFSIDDAPPVEVLDETEKSGV